MCILHIGNYHIVSLVFPILLVIASFLYSEECGFKSQNYNILFHLQLNSNTKSLVKKESKQICILKCLQNENLIIYMCPGIKVLF